MSKRKTTKSIKLPYDHSKINSTPVLPFNGKLAEKYNYFSFSFACFDRQHELFNLGSNSLDGTISGKWFLDLLDCLKSVNNMTISDLKKSMHDLHPIDFSKTNVKNPTCNPQLEYWQFRINKSKGRVIGFLIDGIFYVVWLDPYHNLTNSKGYGGINKYKPALSSYELQELKIKELEKENSYLRQVTSVFK